METSPRVPPQEFADSMKQEMEQYLKGVMEVVNNAADGEWIAGSEEQVRDLAAQMRQHIFERAVQRRVDAAEAAFPPSALSDDGQAAGGRRARGALTQLQGRQPLATQSRAGRWVRQF